MAEQFRQREFGSRPGELATPSVPSSTSPPEPLEIPEPDWAAELRERAVVQRQLDAEQRRRRGEIGPESLVPPLEEDTSAIPKRKAS